MRRRVTGTPWTRRHRLAPPGMGARLGSPRLRWCSGAVVGWWGGVPRPGFSHPGPGTARHCRRRARAAQHRATARREVAPAPASAVATLRGTASTISAPPSCNPSAARGTAVTRAPATMMRASGPRLVRSSMLVPRPGGSPADAEETAMTSTRSPGFSSLTVSASAMRTGADTMAARRIGASPTARLPDGAVAGEASCCETPSGKPAGAEGPRGGLNEGAACRGSAAGSRGASAGACARGNQAASAAAVTARPAASACRLRRSALLNRVHRHRRPSVFRSGAKAGTPQGSGTGAGGRPCPRIAEGLPVPVDPGDFQEPEGLEAS